MTSGTKISGNTDGPEYKIRSWSGSNDPAHKAENPYTVQIKLRRNPLMSEVHTPTGQVMWTRYQGYGINETKPIWSGLSENALLSKVATELRGHDFNAATSGAEIHKTLDSVVNSAKSVFTAYTAVKRGNIPEAVRAFARAAEGSGHRDQRRRIDTRSVSGTWLSMKYGWEPLLDDIYEGMKWFESKTAAPRVLRFKAAKLQEGDWDDHTVGSNYPFWVKTRIIQQLRLKYVESISAARSLGLMNPASAAWEVLPFSFVVDWFIPIGNYLENVGFFNGLNLTYARSAYYTIEGSKPFQPCRSPSWTPTGPQWPHTQYCHPLNVPNSRVHTCSGPTYRKTIWLDRTLGSSLSVPLPSFKTVEKAFSLGHIQNAGALIHQMMANARK